MLSIENVKSAYGRIEVLHGVTLHVEAGEIVTLIGANGAGKTTLMHAISGVQPITEGIIRYEGKPIEQRPAHARVALGISQVPEGRQIFEPLSVKDNLMLGAWLHRDGDLQRKSLRAFARCFRCWKRFGRCRRVPCQADSSKCLQSVEP